MVFPVLLPAAAAFLGRQVGKSGAEDEANERIDLAKKLAALTPAQAAAFDAIKAQPIEEVRARVELKLGPYAPLPPNAAQKAQDIRNARIAAGTLTPTSNATANQKAAQIVASTPIAVLAPHEAEAIQSSPNPDATFNAIADQKAAQILSTGVVASATMPPM
jgi:hypothetical protein